MATFEELGLSEKTLDAVRQMGYTEATPVQEQAIPLVLAGHDVIAAAQTGTGKTAAFTLPVMDKLGHYEKGQGPLALIVTPTRELAQQIDNVARAVGKKTGHWVLTCVGGLSYNPQINGLRRGVDVLVATPGRLLDLYERGALKLDDIQVLVLDEADRMLDMGFWPDVKRIIDALPTERQTLLFSATIDESVMKTIGAEVHDPQFVEIAHKGTAAETVEQFVTPVSQLQKPELLNEVFKQRGAERVIVFTRTKFRAEALADRLWDEGYRAEAIHGDRSQGQRSRALKAFRDGRIDVIVATDVLARGIDVSDVNYVVNYDVPMDPEDYIHRIGRTGRAGEKGFAITFVTRDELNDFYGIEYLMQRVVPTMDFDEFEFDDNRPFLDPERTCDRKPRKGGKGRGRGRGRGGYGDRGGRGGRGGYDRDRRDRGDRGGYGRERSYDRERPRHGEEGNRERTRLQSEHVERAARADAELRGTTVPKGERPTAPVRNREERRAEKFGDRGNYGRDRSYGEQRERTGYHAYDRDRGGREDRGDRERGYGRDGGSRGYDRGGDRGGYRGGNDRGYNRDDRGGSRGYDRGGYRGGNDGGSRGYNRDDRGSRGYDRGGNDRGYGRGSRDGGSRGYDRGGDRGGSRGYRGGNDGGSRGYRGGDRY